MSSELQAGKVHSSRSGDAQDEGMPLNALADNSCSSIHSETVPCGAEAVAYGAPISSSFSIAPISDAATFISGYAFKSQDFGEVGVPVIKIKNIQDKQVTIGDAQCVPASLITERLKKFELKSGDLLIAMTGQGSVGRVGRVQCNEGQRMMMNQRVGRFIADEKKLHLDYLYFVISSEPYERFFFDRGSGSGQPNLSPENILSVQIPYPSFDEQLGIAAVLNALDDRIALLRETNATLEAMAQALFKSWFVDFDPVHANAGTKQMINPASSPSDFAGDPAAPLDSRLRGNDDLLPPELQTLFPATFTETPQGLVPEGWSFGKVEDLLELAYGKALKATDRIDGDIPVYGSGGITGSHNQSLVNGPSVIVGRKGTVGSLYWEDRPFFPIDTVFYVKTEKPLSYCFYLLQTLGLHDMNTDGAVPGLNRNNVYRLPVVIPSDAVFNAFDETAAAIREAIFTNNQQAQTLATLRDTLLPRLISGQLRLPEVESLIEELP